MATLWPWLAIAGLGALHGLSPANGWLFAAACGLRAGDRAGARDTLPPIALGHAVALALLAWSLGAQVTFDRGLVQALAGALLVVIAGVRLLRGDRPCSNVGWRGTQAGLALWSFVMALAHGAHLALVPALGTLCLSVPAQAPSAPGLLWEALLIGVVHTAAMVLTTGLVAAGVCRGLSQLSRWRGAGLRHAWTAVLAVSGALLLAGPLAGR